MMPDDPRSTEIVRLLLDHVRSPSLAHIRQPEQIQRLALAILRNVDGPTSPWRKWSLPRETVARAALPCWLPERHLCEELNQLPGPPLTIVDVVQRMEAMREEDCYSAWPDDDLKAGCLVLYERERKAGTELLAIIGAMRAWIDAEEERLRGEREATRRARVEADRIASQNRLLSGADCPWTQTAGIGTWHSRRNGRLYRLVQLDSRLWVLSRIAAMADKRGIEIGRYESRKVASKMLADIAYQPDLIEAQ